MKALAFSNNDVAVVAWTFDSRLDGCLGFAIYRTDVKAGIETCLPALATFPGQEPTQHRTTATDPVQKFWWKDVYAKRGGSYRYRVMPMAGSPGSPTPMTIGSLTSNVVQLTPDHCVLSCYFNRGILATQATAKAIHDHSNANAMKAEVVKRIDDPSDRLRLDLAWDMIEALTRLPKGAAATGATLWSALCGFENPELLQTLFHLKGDANLILSNMPGTENGTKTVDTYAAEREAAKSAGLKVTDRMMPSGHIGRARSRAPLTRAPPPVRSGHRLHSTGAAWRCALAAIEPRQGEEFRWMLRRGSPGSDALRVRHYLLGGEPHTLVGRCLPARGRQVPACRRSRAHQLYV